MRRGPAGLGAILVLSSLPAIPGPQLLAQAADARGGLADPEPAWLARWRPLDRIGDLPREMPATEHRFADLLTRPGPRVGLFWTAGNPAGLPFELEDTRVDFSFSLARDVGDYRRPLDPGSRARGTLEGTGWRRLGPGGAVIGGLSVRRASLTEGVFSDVLVPYGASPFVVLDTIGDAQNRTIARIEGAGGWRFGRVAVGLGLGYESEDTRTKRTNVPRTNTTATPGATVGVAWDVPGGTLRIGAHARWQQTALRLSIFSLGAPSRVYAPDGYTEPVAFDLSADIFQRRFERTARAAGASAEVRLGAGLWVGYAQREALSEDRFSPRTNDPLTDEWDADGWSVGAATIQPLGPLSLWVESRYTALDGEGVRGDIALRSFTSADRAWHAAVRVTWQGSERWQAALDAAVRRRTTERTDLIEQVRADIRSWSPSIAFEVARSFGRRFGVSLAGSAIRYSATASTPDPSAIGPAYTRWIAPELGLLATGGTGFAGRSAFRLALSDGNAVWVRIQARSASPDEAFAGFGDSPHGDRTGWLVTVGVTLEPG